MLFFIKFWKVVFEVYGTIFILFVQDNFCGWAMLVLARKKGAMIRKPGVENDTIDRFEGVFVASHKENCGERLEEYTRCFV